MPTIRIGDRECSFEGEKTILQVALEHDVHIPHYCYHPGLSIVASCRICLAEVAQPNPKTGELQKLPKMIPTCQHPAVDGAEVYLDSERTVANQKAVMEYLLINHPLDCPICDKAGECLLQDYSYIHGRAYSRFEETKVKQPKKDVGPNILLYSDRCIMCDRCVRFTREVTGTGELCRVQRGNRTEIEIFPGRPLDNELSGNVADICPVGALKDKQFLFQQRVWYLEPIPGIDPITASGDNLWVDVNDQRIWRLRPRPNLDVNKWWTSDEIRYGWRFVHDEARLRRPQVRGRQEDEKPLRWSDALEVAAGAMREARVALLVSPMLSCEEAYLLGWMARQLGEGALVGVGPVPRVGEDKSFPGGYTIHAEKAPNARGVRRALELIHPGAVLDYHGWLEQLGQADVAVLTGNYPSEWVTQQLADAVARHFTILMDTLPNRLTEEAAVLLPAATWAEKAGTFENVHGRLQAFERAIQPIEFVRPEGQIALDLLEAADLSAAATYDAAGVREQMGGVFRSEVHLPTRKETRQPEMRFVEL